MKALIYLACTAIIACTPVRSQPTIAAVVDGTQHLSADAIQETTYRLTLRRPPSDAVDCSIGLSFTLLRSGTFDAGEGSTFDPSLGIPINVQVAAVDVDGGLSWWVFGGTKAMPGNGTVGAQNLWSGKSEEHVEYVRVRLENGTGPLDALEYTHSLDFAAHYSRDTADISTQEMSLDVMVDGGWVPSSAVVRRSDQGAECTGPVTPLGCR